MDWMPIVSKANLRMLVWAYVGLMLILFVWQWRSKRAVGLPLAYALVLAICHLAGAFAYSFDYYEPHSAVLVQMLFQLKDTFAGFWATVVGFASFVVGVIVTPLFFTEQPRAVLSRPWPQVTSKLPGTLLITAICFFLFGPILRRIPSVASTSVSGASLAVLAVFLSSYEAFKAKRIKAFTGWMLSTLTFPAVTIVFLGFAGYGIVAAANAWQMIFRFFRPRVLALLVLITLCYSGLSVYVNYMRERGNIRDSVWKAQSMSVRIDKSLKIFSNFEFFNPYNRTHLEIVDLRLNQNDLVGKCITYIDSGRVDFAQGGTLIAAAVSWIPRILWPNKPKTGGSGNLVSYYTGLKFGDGTSVGAGLVMELYLNWGMTSVIIGFFLLAVALTYIDQQAAFYLQRGDYWTFVRWALPGLAMISPGGALTEVVGGTAASFVLVTVMHMFFFGKYYENVPTPRSTEGRGSRNAYPTHR